MRRRHWVAFLLAVPASAGLLAPRSASAADPLDAIRARLDDAPLLRGQFAQMRRLAGFRNPLRSSGDFVLARGRGVLWLTRKPFASTLIVTAERIESRDAQGQRTSVLDARNEPALRTVNTLLLAALAADLAPLRTLFAIDGEMVADGGWRLALTPTDKALAVLYTRVAMSGERHVQTIRLDERNGDSTEISFTAVSGATAATAAEEALFAGRGG